MAQNRRFTRAISEIAAADIAGGACRSRQTRVTLGTYYFGRFFDNSASPGATGFDRMATVTVACPGRSLGLVNHVSKTSTANNSDVSGRVGFNAPLAMAA